MVAGARGSFHKAGTTKMPNSTTTAGIDTSKATLEVAIHGADSAFSAANAANGWDDIIRRLRQAGVTRVGIEASGGYERGIIRHLRRHGFTVVLMQPAQVKAFARLHLRRAKNDRLDAALIAACVAAIDDDARTSDPRLEMLADHLTFIEQIEEDIARIKTRLEHIHAPRLRRLAEADLARLIKRRDAEIARCVADIRKHDDLARRLALILSVPGIGTRTAVSLLVRMPELGSVTREQAAALAGLAPFDDDSGKRRGQRHIAGGRGRVRRAIYAAALPAAFRWNPALVDFYKKLVAAGKPHKLALTACARKLLVYANTVLQRGEPWVPVG